MTPSELTELSISITRDAKQLKDEMTGEIDAPVNYICVFAHSEEEFESLETAAHGLGTIVQATPTGPVFRVDGIETDAGKARLLKVRRPDPSRTERGDADFTIPASRYEEFKAQHLGRAGFNLIVREKFEMVELASDTFDILVYFSNPPLDVQLGINTPS